MSETRYRVAVVGATGAVGAVMRQLLAERRFPTSEVVGFASPRSAGTLLDERMVVQTLDERAVEGFDLALFSAGAAVSRAWAPAFAAAGAVVVDNSSAWRMHDEVPLVVAEVNPGALAGAGRGIIANPNCTTMIAMLPLKALHDVFALRSFVATSFQAAGGAGQRGMDELAGQVRPLLEARSLLVSGRGAARALVALPRVNHDVLAFNVVPLLGRLADGPCSYTDEELKLVFESRKILGLPNLAVAPTCVRVPVMVGHTIELRAVFEREVSLADALAALHAFPGLVVQTLPTPLEWAGRDEVAVGRVRRDLDDPRILNFVVVGDNLRKGAALNAVQIAELLVAGHALG